MRAIGLMKHGEPEVLELIEMAGVVGFKPTVHGIKTVDIVIRSYQDSHYLLK